MVEIPIVCGVDWPWPSSANLTWKSNSTAFWACSRDNLSSVQARITKFGAEMHLSTVKIPVVLGVDRSWPSRSNLTQKSKFTPFWVCRHDNLSPVQTRITKVVPEVHFSTVRIPIDFGLHKPSVSISFLIVKAIFRTYLHCFCITFSETAVCKNQWDHRWLQIESVSSLHWTNVLP